MNVKLIRLRKEPALSEGDISIYSENNLLFIKRMYQGNGYVLISNMSSFPVHIDGNIILKNKYNINKEIEPGGFVVMKVYK